MPFLYEPDKHILLNTNVYARVYVHAYAVFSCLCFGDGHGLDDHHAYGGQHRLF